MRRGLGRRSGAAAALVLAYLVGGPASPVGADPVISIASPAPDEPLQTATVTISGTVKSSAPLLNTPRRVILTLQGNEPVTVECATASCPFSWAPSIPLNGPYDLTVSATEGPVLLGVDGASATQNRHFTVAAPAARPVLDPPRVTNSRTVELSWSRNPEPDLLYYAVFRKDPGSPAFFPVSAKVPQPGKGAKPTFTDAGTSAFGGGDYAYKVVAVRTGPTGTATSEVKSAESVAASATVPIPTSTSSITPPVAGPPAAGPTTAAKPAPPGGVDLAGFLSSRSQPVALPPVTVPELPDTGFSGSLPFAARTPGDDVEDGGAEAVLPGRRSGSVVSVDAARPLVPVAGGLVLLLLALHMRLLGRRVKPAADADLPIEAPALLPAPLPGPAPEAPAPASPVDWEQDWDDGWAAGEPELEPDAEWAPVAVAEPDPDGEPELAPDAEPAPQPASAPVVGELEPEAEPEAEPEPEPEVVTLWAPPAPEVELVQDEVYEQPEEAAADPDEIEVIEVVSSTRHRLVRAGGR